METKHSYSPFDKELDEIKNRILLMGEQASNQFTHAIKALKDNDLALIENVIKNEKLINRQESEVDRMGVNIIARHAPTAIDLRLLMVIMQMSTDLERVGDEAKKTAKNAREIILSNTNLFNHSDLIYASTFALDMLREALDAFARMDPKADFSLRQQDKQLDELVNKLIEQFTTLMQQNPQDIPIFILAIYIAKSIERVGDHSKNIAYGVNYIVSGRDPLERKAELKDLARQEQEQN